jgi:ferredoxin
MKQVVEIMREIAARSLSHGEVDLVLGWQKGDFWWQSYPAFVERESEVNSLIWDLFCVPNLSKYLLEELQKRKRVAIFVKGCDSLAFNQMLQDRRVVREKVVLYGIPCGRLVDPGKVERTGLDRNLLEVKRDGEKLLFVSAEYEKRAGAEDYYYDKCLTCRFPTPVISDELLGEAASFSPRDRFEGIKKLEKMKSDERFDYWARQFSRCIRCFACRNVCPACSCRECVFDIPEPRWLGKANELSETQFYHIIRAYHVAGRCVDCGECSRVCPVRIPLQELNRKFIKDINELYGEYDAGIDPEKELPLVTYNVNDPEAFSGS